MKKFNLFAAMLIVFTMLFSTIVSANPPILNEDGALVSQDADNPVEVAISKILQLPIGTTTPNATFSFLATPISVEGNTSEEAIATMPELTDNMTVSFTVTDVDADELIDNIMSIVMETDNIFAGVNFPHAGIFIYEITEIDSTNPTIDDKDNIHEFLSYSKAKYTLRIYVANKTDINGDIIGTYVYAVGAIITIPDNGDQTVDYKVDPTPGGGSKFEYSQMIFTNDYVKTNGTTNPENPDPVTESTLAVSKRVTGDLANIEQYFDFSITLTIPSLVVDVPQYYRAYVIENNTVVNNGSYIQVRPGVATAFSLKHGQRLVFVDTPVGTSYTVEEVEPIGYTPSVIVITNAEEVYKAEGKPSETLSTDVRFVGELANSAAFTNNRSNVVPTGINISNLPFVGLIVLAIVALIGFVAIKSRKRGVVA